MVDIGCEVNKRVTQAKSNRYNQCEIMRVKVGDYFSSVVCTCVRVTIFHLCKVDGDTIQNIVLFHCEGKYMDIVQIIEGNLFFKYVEYKARNVSFCLVKVWRIF